MTENPSTMTPAELQAIIDEAYGRRAQRKLAADVGKTEVTVSRWLSGHTPIAETESVLIRLILMLARKKIGWRKWMDDYMAKKEVSSVDELL